LRNFEDFPNKILLSRTWALFKELQDLNIKQNVPGLSRPCGYEMYFRYW